MKTKKQEPDKFIIKKKLLPVRTICRNCDTQQISRYCHNCGQDIFSGSERSVKEITMNFLETVLALDNKLIVTLKYLMFYPGKLTKDFFEGKVSTYVFPAKLFWFMSILFFATLTIDSDDVQISKKDVSRIIEIVEKDVSSESMRVTNKDEVSGEIEEIVNHRIKNNALEKQFMNYAPYAMFLLIPFFALLIQLFYFRKYKYYVRQMIFSLHFHTYVFLAFSILNLLVLVFPAFDNSSTSSWAYILIPAIYFIISLYVVYRPKKRHLLWKFPLIVFLYVTALLFAIILLALIVGVLIHGVSILDEVFD